MNPLIYGKDQTERVVGLEVCDHQTELFIENIDGTVISRFLTNKFYILSNYQQRPDWIRLSGNLHYKWVRPFETRNEFLKARSYLKKGGKDIWSIYNEKEAFMVRNGVTYFKGMKHDEPSIMSWDLETTGLKKDETSRILLISTTFRKLGRVYKRLFPFDEYGDVDTAQKPLLEAFCAYVRECNPAIMTGHNINMFDLPYMDHVANMFDAGLDMGRDGSCLTFDKYSSYFRKDQTTGFDYYRANVWGRNIVDTMFIAIKSDIKKEWETYGLKYLVKVMGLEKKDRVFYDAAQIRFKYKDKKEWELIKQYCIDDSDDGLALYDKLITPFFYFTTHIPKTFQQITESASGSQLNSIMLRSYLQDGHSIPRADEISDFFGAISYGNPGIWKNCLKWDVASLYPSIMLQYDIYDKYKDPKRNMLAILEYFTNERLKNKQLGEETGDSYYKHLADSQKIGINSMYGFLSTSGLNFNSPTLAPKVTEYGRDILIKAVQWATGKGMKQVEVDGKKVWIHE